MADMNGLLIAKGDEPAYLLPKLANRHGLIAGATGTGKTVTLKVMAEQLSNIGVPVFLADIKGDLRGMTEPGSMNDKIAERVKTMDTPAPDFKGFPVQFWDLYGKNGQPIRATVSQMGPLLLSRILELNDTQEAVLAMIFKVADDQGLHLIDIKDLKAMLQFASQHASELQGEYGNMSTATIGSIQRGVLNLEQQGADNFFGEPELDLSDFLRTTNDGRGVVNILEADQLMQSPMLYATFLLWMLSELYEMLPEVGDPEKPKLVFFFDEAHLLFDNAPSALLQKIEQVVRLIRSKGVGVYFITQNPVDVPDTVLGQLGNRVQHAIRAFSPKEQKAVEQAAETYRTNPKLDVARVVQELAVGEALVSFLQADGTPAVVERAMVMPPQSQFGSNTPEQMTAAVNNSPLASKYDATVDNVSAFESLRDRNAAAASAASVQTAATEQAKLDKAAAKSAPTGSNQVGDLLGAFAKSTTRAIGSSVGRQIVRGIMGSIFGGGSKSRY